MKRSTASENDTKEETPKADVPENLEKGEDWNNKNEKSTVEVCTAWQCQRCGADCYSKCIWDRSVHIRPKSDFPMFLRPEYSLLDSHLSFEEKPADELNKDERLEFKLSIPYFIAEGKSRPEVLKQFSKLICEMSDQDLNEILCTFHDWIPAPGKSNKCSFGHDHGPIQ